MTAMANTLYERAPMERDPGKPFVRFFARPVIDTVASDQAGRPVFVTRDWVEISRAGEVDVLSYEATRIYQLRYKAEWEAYKEGREQIPNGTPLVMLFPSQPDIVATLAYFRTHTVEQLAAITDTAMQGMGLGGFEWRKKAQEFLATARSGAGFHQLKRAVDDRDATIDALQAKIAALEGRLAESERKAADPGDMQAMVQAAVAQQLAAQHMAPGQQIGGSIGESRAARQRRLRDEAPAIPTE